MKKPIRHNLKLDARSRVLAYWRAAKPLCKSCKVNILRRHAA